MFLSYQQIMNNIIFSEDMIRKQLETSKLKIRLKGTSMLPTFKMGDYVYIQKATEKIKIGDIVVFYANSELVLHRAVHIFGDYIITKGDNNNYLDSPMKPNQILGVVESNINGLG